MALPTIQERIAAAKAKIAVAKAQKRIDAAKAKRVSSPVQTSAPKKTSGSSSTSSAPSTTVSKDDVFVGPGKRKTYCWSCARKKTYPHSK